ESGQLTQEAASVDPPSSPREAENWSQFPSLSREAPTAADDFAARKAPSPAGGELPIAADGPELQASEHAADLAAAQPPGDVHPVAPEGSLPIAPGGPAMPPAQEAEDGTIEDAAAALPSDGAREADAEAGNAAQAVADRERTLPAGATARPVRPLTH